MIYREKKKNSFFPSLIPLIFVIFPLTKCRVNKKKKSDTHDDAKRFSISTRKRSCPYRALKPFRPWNFTRILMKSIFTTPKSRELADKIGLLPDYFSSVLVSNRILIFFEMILTNTARVFKPLVNFKHGGKKLPLVQVHVNDRGVNWRVRKKWRGSIRLRACIYI